MYWTSFKSTPLELRPRFNDELLIEAVGLVGVDVILRSRMSALRSASLRSDSVSGNCEAEEEDKGGVESGRGV